MRQLNQNKDAISKLYYELLPILQKSTRGVTKVPVLHQKEESCRVKLSRLLLFYREERWQGLFSLWWDTNNGHYRAMRRQEVNVQRWSDTGLFSRCPSSVTSTLASVYTLPTLSLLRESTDSSLSPLFYLWPRFIGWWNPITIFFSGDLFVVQ